MKCVICQFGETEPGTTTVTIRTAEIERSVSADLREGPEDYVSVEAGHISTLDLFPRIEEIYQECLTHFRNGSTLLAIFQLKRL